MGNYKVTDNKTGRSFNITGPRPPSQEEVANLIATKTQESQLPQLTEGEVDPNMKWGSYKPEERQEMLSGLRKTRPDLVKGFVEELKYNPMTDKSKGVTRKAIDVATKMPSLMFKGVGALSQKFESVVGGAAGAEQRGEMGKGEYIGRSLLGPLGMLTTKGTVDALTGKEQHQYGDIGRGAGMTERGSQLMGLAAAALEPGAEHIGAKTSRAAALTGKGITEGTESGVKAGMKGQLQIFTGRHGDAVQRFIDDPEKIIMPKLKEKDVTAYVMAGIDRVKKMIKEVPRDIGKKFNEVASRYDSGLVKATNEAGESVTEGAHHMIRTSQFGDVVETVVGKGDDAVVKKSLEAGRHKGMKKVMDILDDVDGVIDDAGNANFGKIRKYVGELDSAISENSIIKPLTGESIADPAAAKANALAARLKEDLLSILTAESDEYRQIKTLYGNSAKARNAVQDILKGADPASIIAGEADLSNALFTNSAVLDFNPELRKMVTEVFGEANGGVDLVETIKDLGAQHAFKRILPSKGASLAAAGTGAVAVVTGNPRIAAALLAGGAGSSPRLMGNLYRRALLAGDSAGMKLLRTAGEKIPPRVKALAGILQRGFMRGVSQTYPRRKAIQQEMQQEQQQ